MTDPSTFTGFPAAGLQFLRDLEANNNRDWFEANKSTYQEALLEPALAFVAVVGQRLQAIDPTIQYDLRTNGQGTLMRIYRDVRFSEDKSPYKTNISGLWTDGLGKKNDRPAFGFQMTASGMELMAGKFNFSKSELDAYRAAVTGDKAGPALESAVAALTASGAYEMNGQTYKRVPRGYDNDHPRADLLRYSGLWAHPLQPMTELTSPALVDITFDQFEDMAPIYSWLREHIA